ncbi:MAG: hypothetical protein DRI36_02985 [Caldiserica bacterium]|nr:MAG: hypothetical protein DRI36_02985 [Caldisericota bacterium]
MIELKKAQNLLLKNLRRMEKEILRLPEAIGRVSFEDIRSNEDLPSFNRSLMDGYAVRDEDVKTTPCVLKVRGIIPAGKIFKGRIKKGECVKIMTGAVVPSWAERVIKKEDVEVIDKESVKILRIGWDRNISYKGEILRKNEIILRKGEVVNEFKAALLALFGVKKVKVYKKPKVCLITTGDEIVFWERKVETGKVRDVVSLLIPELFNKIELPCKHLGRVKDRKNEIFRIFKKTNPFDIILFSGGVSMGDYDLIPEFLKEIGAEIVFHKVKTKPGKPLLFAKFKNKFIFGLPGNIVSSIVSFYNFLRPAVLYMMGLEDVFVKFYEGFIEEDIYIKSDRLYFVPSIAKFKNGKFYLKELKFMSSQDVYSVSRANSFIVFDDGIYKVKEGSKVRFFLL